MGHEPPALYTVEEAGRVTPETDTFSTSPVTTPKTPTLNEVLAAAAELTATWEMVYPLPSKTPENGRAAVPIGMNPVAPLMLMFWVRSTVSPHSLGVVSNAIRSVA